MKHLADALSDIPSPAFGEAKVYTEKGRGMGEHRMSEWNFDMSQAPRGKDITRTVAAGKDADGNLKTRRVEEFIPDYIWAASNCGKVVKSWWIPATKHHNGYFYGFASDPKYGSGPLAWQLFVVPAHPTPSDTQEQG